MFDTKTRLLFFACLKKAAGAALKNVALAPTNKKIGSGTGAAPKSGGSRQLWLRLLNTVKILTKI